MTDLSSDWEVTGWGYLTDGTDVMWFAFENWTGSIGASPEGDDLPGDGHYGYDLGARKRVVKFTNVVFGARADCEEMVKELDEWNNAGTFTLKVKVKSDGTFFKLDGSSTTLAVLFEDIRGLTKLSAGDQQKYGFQQLVFRQYG